MVVCSVSSIAVTLVANTRRPIFRHVVHALAVLAVLVAASAVFANVAIAQNLKFLGGGSSAMFLELGQAAQSSAVTNTPCVWTHTAALNLIITEDDRATLTPGGLPIDEYGDIWITWGPGTGTCQNPSGNYDVYAYTSLDSVIGVRCYFEVDTLDETPGCLQYIEMPAGTAGENLLCNAGGPCTYGPDTNLPAAIIGAVNFQHWFAAATDILPEDSKFAIARMFSPCTTTVYRQAFRESLREMAGLGYQGPTQGIGVAVLSYFSETAFHPLDFNFVGNDPINVTQPVPAYGISTIGAKPILVAVSPAGGTGIGAASDITSFNFALFTAGVIGRTTDLLGPTTTLPVTTLINEPLSGPYNVVEYSVPNSSQFHTSQDIANCNYANGTVGSNAMYLQSTNGAIPAVRARALGTAEMISQIQAAPAAGDQRLGYFYWSAANASSFTAANGKYLTLNGVDPIQNAYTDGVLPGVDSAHPISNVTFTGLNSGDYPLWSVLRIVSTIPTPIGVTNLITAAQQLNTTQHNFISAQNMQIWHSHYYLPFVYSNGAALGTTIATAGDLCPIAGAMTESGGDLGGTTVLKQVNYDFCVDFSNVTGLINASN